MSKHSLNALAAFLVLADRTGDHERELSDILQAVTQDASLPENVHALMVDARDRWQTAKAADRPTVFDEVQHLVGAAQSRLELRDRLSLMLPDLPPASDPLYTDHQQHPFAAPAARPSLVPADADRAFLRDFIAECRQLLEGAEAALLSLEIDPDDVEAVNTIFRAFHTIKGTSAFLSLDYITEFAHLAEALLSRVRDREIRCVGGYAELALRSNDVLSALLDATERAIDGKEDKLPEEYSRMLAVVRDPEAAGISEADGALPHTDQVATAVSRLPPMRRAGPRSESTVRVRTEHLDRLVEMVGELVIAESMISQDAIVAAGGSIELKRKISHAEKIVRELQDLSMAMRMVPLKALFQKVARLVRDLGARSGKRVEFVAVGEDTEIDRNMVDSISDPLVHMIRNSMDHGIESPEQRRASGKPGHGTIRLSAYHAAGNVVVELSDDGRGLDRERLVGKAIQRGLVASGDGLSDKDVHDFIFAPGFSTAETITDVSGRGVGMDVVRRNIEALSGRVEIHSTTGQSTTFLVRLPLTLAITDGMLVQVGGERYIVPTASIHVSFRPARSALSTLAGRGEMVILHDAIMPLVRLHRVFGVPAAKEDPTEALLMVVGDGVQRTALLVDDLLGQHQVVAKALGDGIGRIPGISGGAILGDGRVGLILDVNELVALARHGEFPSGRIHCLARAAA